MEHHIKIAIPHIMSHTKLISSSSMTLSSPNILERSLGGHMRSSLTSWHTSIIGMRQPSLRSWWRPWRMLLSHPSVACPLRLVTAIPLFDVSLVLSLVPKKRSKLPEISSLSCSSRMVRNLKSLLNRPYESPWMHGENCQLI